MVDGVLGQARAGASGVLLVAGEPGVGKSALLEYAVQSASASGFQVVRAAGVEPEMELAFAGLQQLCAPLLDGLAQLPGPQRAAIETAFGVSAGVPPDPFFVGLGVLGLLSAAAAARPLLCVVDDVQWLDQASARALGVAARRLQADAVAVLLAGREPGELAGAAGLAEVRLAGLADADARALLASVLPQWVDQKVVDRIVAETAGNPLALLELPRGMTPAELAGGPGFGGTAGLPGRIEESFRRRLELLPEPTRRLVLLAAADPAGDAALLWRACALAGIDPGGGPAEDAGLVQVGTRVRFFHPLVRSAVFRAASAEGGGPAHGCGGGDRRGRRSGPAGLASGAGRAGARRAGGRRAGGLRRAGPGPRRGGRGGGVPGARGRADAGPAAALGAGWPRRRPGTAGGTTGRWSWWRSPRPGRWASWAGPRPSGCGRRSSSSAPTAATARCSCCGPRSGSTRWTGTWPGRLIRRDAGRPSPATRWRRGGGCGALSQPPDATELLLHGYGVFVTEGFPHGVDVLAQAIDAFVSAPVSGDENIRALEAAAAAARALQDGTGFDVLTARVVALARQVGALSLLPEALDLRALYCVDAGEWLVRRGGAG